MPKYQHPEGPATKLKQFPEHGEGRDFHSWRQALWRDMQRRIPPRIAAIVAAIIAGIMARRHIRGVAATRT
jgi:hypothetical protein